MSPHKRCTCNTCSPPLEEEHIRILEVKRLPKLTNTWELQELFSVYGRIEQLVLKLQNNQLRAFVTFHNTSDAKMALQDGEENRVSLHNRVLTVLSSRNQPPRPSEETEINPIVTRTAGIDSGRNIDMLNNDCLAAIFKYLPIVDRIKIERVCKRWRSVSQTCWSYEKYLTLSDSTWDILETSTSNVDRKKLCAVLRRCGTFLKAIDLPYIDAEIYSEALSDIVKFCPNLEEIELEMSAISSDSLRLLGNNCHNIRRLALNAPKCSDGSALSEFFQQSTRLTHVTVGFKLGDSILKLPSTIRKLVLRSCGELEFTCLAQVLPRLKNLSKLVLNYPEGSGDKNLPAGVLEAVSRNCEQLEVLNLSGFRTVGLTCQAFITNLANLKYLFLNCKINDEFLWKISRNCKDLMSLEINSWNITLAGIEMLTALPNLIKLRISEHVDLQSVPESWSRFEPSEIQKLPRISSFPSLTYLECGVGCCLSPSEMLSIIESAPELEQVTFWYRDVHDQTIEWLITETLAVNNKVLFDLWKKNSQ